MLPHSRQINESQVDNFHACIFGELFHFTRSSRHSYFSFRLLFDTQAQVAWWRPEANPEKECLEIEPGQRFLFAEIGGAMEFRLTGRVGSRCGIAGYSFSENAKDTLRNLSDNNAIWIHVFHARA
jgi:hypothetical protein